mmetsp:Transcript_28180/g.38777  ORF Transcript_28180/g.38777 Transcript_28180/m.38777 type:complete len:425 (-) Transcript_28180:163-1437(-)
MLNHRNVFEDNDSSDEAELLSLGSFNTADIIPTQVVPTQLDPVILIDFGQRHPDWILFLSTLSESSKPRYEKTILDFITWISSGEDTSLPAEQLFRDYFVMIHESNNMPGAASFAPSRYRSMASVFVSFWTYSGKGDLKLLAPAVWVYISGWERGYIGTHSTAFTKEQLLDFHEKAQGTPNNLFLKCYSSLMCSFAARSSELVKMDWKDIVRVTEDVSGRVFYKLTYDRSKKRSGIASKTDKVSFIRGDFEVKAIDNWIACFKTEEDRKGRFFRKLLSNSVRGIYPSNTPIGKNSCASVGKQIATFLELPNPQSYTGQCWRGTAATILADEGFTAQEIKRVTGHKSDAALQVYVDNSKVSKDKAAKALAVGNDSQFSSSPPLKKHCLENTRGSLLGGQENIHYHINITMGENVTCTGLSLFGNN